jgi:hypothetical protein
MDLGIGEDLGALIFVERVIGEVGWFLQSTIHGCRLGFNGSGSSGFLVTRRFEVNGSRLSAGDSSDR